MQESKLTTWRNQQQAIRLSFLAGHLGEEFGPRNADRDGQSDAVADVAAQPVGICTGVPETRRSPPTSKNASSTEIGSTSGDVSRKTSKTASLACV